jgi:hypothetical protein
VNICAAPSRRRLLRVSLELAKRRIDTPVVLGPDREIEVAQIARRPELIRNNAANDLNLGIQPDDAQEPQKRGRPAVGRRVERVPVEIVIRPEMPTGAVSSTMSFAGTARGQPT